MGGEGERDETRRDETRHTSLGRCYALGNLFKLLTPFDERVRKPARQSLVAARLLSLTPMLHLPNVGFDFDFSSLIKRVRTSCASLAPPPPATITVIPASTTEYSPRHSLLCPFLRAPLSTRLCGSPSIVASFSLFSTDDSKHDN